MPAILSSYALVGLDAVPVDVVVDGDRVQVVDPETGRCRLSVDAHHPFQKATQHVGLESSLRR